MEYSADDFIGSLPKERQDKIEEGFQEMKAEYMALQELRKAMKFTQQSVANELHMAQGNLSNLEKRTDVMISTLRRYIEAMGGSLKIIAQFPERPPVELSGFSSDAAE